MRHDVIVRKCLISAALLAVATAGSACAQTESPSMVAIPAGEFTMGTNLAKAESQDKPAHQVFVHAFQIDRTEVTVRDYKKCIDANVCRKIKSRYPGLVSDNAYFATFEPAEPMREVSWYDAERYCKWVGKRLPTEAEWEKAARGPKVYINPWGNNPFTKGDAAIGVGSVYRSGAFAKDKSGYGVLDTAGNVMEWVADWYAGNYYSHSPSRNPTGPSKGTEKVVRGASWQTNIKGDPLRSFFAVTRFGDTPDSISDVIGFRCAK